MPVNITDPQAITDWLQEMSAGDGDIAFWLQKAFTKALLKREKSAAPLREWPQNPPAWMKPGGNYHEFRPDPELKEKVLHIKDWLVAARRQDAAFVTNLPPIKDLASAFHIAERYFRAENKKNQSIVEDDDDTKTIMRFDNGMRIVQLMTLEALKYEGAKMGHCIGAGSYDEGLSRGHKVFYSLRDARNEPHATMEVDVRDNALLQCNGKENKRPVEKYMPMLQQFLKQQQFNLQVKAASCGLVQDVHGQNHSINNLPENLSIGGDLDLAGCTALTKLSQTLSIGGNLDLAGCTALTQLPKDISVEGYLCLRDCTSLKQLPENLYVGGSLNISHCTALKQLSESFSVGGNLHLFRCDNITSIPRSLKCRGQIYTDIGTFNTVTKAADAFDRKYRPDQPRAQSHQKLLSSPPCAGIR